MTLIKKNQIEAFNKSDVWLWNVDNVADASQTSTWALNAWSISSGFWNIDNGTSTLSTWNTTINWTIRAIEWLETNNQTWTTYTLVIWDAGKVVTLNNAAAITLTIPTNASVAFVIWTIINFEQLWAWQVTFWWAWVTINSKWWNLKFTAQFSWSYLRKTATDTWILVWDLSA